MDFQPVHIESVKFTDEIPSWVYILLDNQKELARGLNDIMNVMTQTANTIEAIKDEASPLIQKVSNHPMVRMIAGG